MLQAMNTGHDGSLTTGPRQHPRDMLARLETMVPDGRRRPAGAGHPRADRERARPDRPDQTRMKDGSRKITNITEVQGMEGDVIVLQDMFIFEQTGSSKEGPGQAPADRHPSEVLREVRGARHQASAGRLRRHVRGSSLDGRVPLPAGLFIGVLLFFWGISL